MKILLGIGGGIAAYKSAELVRLYQQRGSSVQAIMTAAAREFIQPLTLAALTGKPVLTDLWAAPTVAGAADDDGAGGNDGTTGNIEHITVAQSAQALVIAPATAHILAKLAAGLADDYLSTVALACPAPLVLAPAMNVEMWRHPATQANVARLRDRGAHIVPPGEGYLACGMTGAGRMAEPELIVAATEAALGESASRPRDLAGEVVLVTAGPTREAVDAVRYLSNRSSGRMGYAIAATAARRGARVVLISGPTALAAPDNVELIRVTTAAEMASAAAAGFADATIALLVAAVADYRPVAPNPGKIKKSAATLRLDLEPTPDILADLGRRKQHRLLIGFAAETEPDPARARELARAKLIAKRADLIVLNDVGRSDIGFDVEENAVTLVGPDKAHELPRAPKTRIADQLLDAVVALRQKARPHLEAGPALPAQP